jgi:nitrate reductase / nitrite oxidoreductase, beta subunit
MDVRAQTVMVFNLDKCLGCHTCSISCKNIWTDRKGMEYAWWNNVETKPGIGFPDNWEDQAKYKGGFVAKNGKLKLKQGGKFATLMSMFYQPNMPKMEDYYEPFDFDYANLHGAPEGDDQPVAEPISKITGKRMEINSGPNWDDDLSGSSLYASEDLNLEDKMVIDEYGKIFMVYLPRMCNHCLNPACMAACPSKAIYKRGEDGIVLIDPNVCRGWRFCTSACPYKKVYYNWNTGKSEKCIFCYPRLETGQCNACAHSCAGKIRYVGVLLYDASRVEEALLRPDADLVEAQRGLILDPEDRAVQEGARANGISDTWLNSAVRSPVYAVVKKYGLALPLHPEFRTMPMAYYIPPLSPVLATRADSYDLAEHGSIPSLDSLRVPISYLSSLFSGGNQGIVEDVLRKLITLRGYMRLQNLGEAADEKMLQEVSLDKTAAAYLHRLFAVGGYNERYVIPPQQREIHTPENRKGGRGFGFILKPKGGI